MSDEESPDRRSVRPKLLGRKRQPNTGVMFVQLIKRHDYSPDWFGEIHLDVNDLHRVIENNGIIPIWGWAKKHKGMAQPVIQLRVSWWKKGDLSSTQVRNNLAGSDDDEWVVPE